MIPVYDYGDEVRLIRTIRNDGTFPGKKTGELLLRSGETGCVRDVGTYLQDQLIYKVHFLNARVTVGCREEELIPAAQAWNNNRYDFRDKVLANRYLSVSGELVVEPGDRGEIESVVRESNTVFFYHVRFGERTFALQEEALDPVMVAEEVLV